MESNNGTISSTSGLTSSTTLTTTTSSTLSSSSQTSPSSSTSTSLTPSSSSTSTPTPTPSSTSPTSTFITTEIASPSTTTVTSTSIETPSTTTSSSSTTPPSASSNAESPALAEPSGNGGGSGGLPESGRIAIAVVIPIVGVALLVLAGLWFWRKRKSKRDAEELRRKEMEEYGFNPNNDPTLPPVGGASANEDEVSTMRERDAGYRGWGTTSSTARKASTTMSSNPGMARSDSGGNGYNTQNSPNGNMTNSDRQSGDPLVRVGEESGGALGAVAAGGAAANVNRGMNRGPSNASSAYSNANRSEVSALSDGPMPGGSPPYPQDYMYTDESQHSNWDSQPVIREVSARRNTRIENAPIVPQQGNAGISQNF